MDGPDVPRVHGRGAAENPPNRFERLHLVLDAPGEDPGHDAGKDAAECAAGAGGCAHERPIATEYFHDTTRTIISRNDSPDVPFETSLNPYRGCEHGCIYCYARPSHEYLGFSAGLDFETKILVKPRAPELLREALSTRAWRPQVLALSGVTDPYQPAERRLEVTRRCLQVLAEFRNPVGVITKSAMVVRDIDALAELAAHGAGQVAVSITTLDEDLRRVMEPRTSTADARLEAVARLSEAGIPVGVMMAPIVPGLTDHEIPRVLDRAAQAGARFAGYIMLRLPHGVAPLFEAWLGQHFPERAQKVLGRIRDLRGGRLSDPRYGSRMRGEGRFAELVDTMFRAAREHAGLSGGVPPPSTAAFRRPGAPRSLFD